MYLNFKILIDFLKLFFPDLCIICGCRLIDQENYICLKCLYEIPLTNYQDIPDNKLEQVFWGRINVDRATALFFFRKGSKYQKIIYHLKYKGLKEIGEYFGKSIGQKLKNHPDFNSIDMIVPVPLHYKKQLERGYNQSEWIARGIAFVLNKPLETENLIRLVETKTQTKKSRYERWQNMEGIFSIKNPDFFLKQHILLVDDVITTGSTLEACVMALLKTGDIKISIAAMAFADN